MERTLVVRVHGTFLLHWDDNTKIELKSTKARALLAMLSLAPNGKHARVWLQSTLWGRATREHRQASLRRCVSELRAAFGEEFDTLFASDAFALGIDLNRVRVERNPQDGAFLEDIAVREDGFNTWLKQNRTAASGGFAARASGLPSQLFPTVAVLPWLVQSNDRTSDNNGFAEFLTAQVTRSMAECKELDMISHLSTRLQSLSKAELDEIKQSLDVDYIIYGTLGRSDQNYVLDVDLTNARNGQLQWSGSIRGSVQSAIDKRSSAVPDLAWQLASQVYWASANLVQSVLMPDAPVSALFLSALTLLHHNTRAGFDRSKLQINHLVHRMPEKAANRVLRATWHLHARAQDWCDNPDHELASAKQFIADCLDINPRNVTGLANNGLADLATGQRVSEAKESLSRAAFIDPQSAIALLGLAYCSVLDGDENAGRAQSEQALLHARIRPHRYWHDVHHAQLLLMIGDDKAALNHANRAISTNRSNLLALTTRVIALDRLDRFEEAARAARILLERHPGFDCSRYGSIVPAVDWTGLPDARLSLQRAGIPSNLFDIDGRDAAE